MLMITRTTIFQPEMPLSTFPGMSGDLQIWKQISLSRVPASKRIQLTRAPRPTFISSAELQTMAPPKGFLTEGLTRSELKVNFKNFPREWEPDGPGFFRFCGGELRVEMTVRIWIDEKYRPAPGNGIGDRKKTLCYGLAMGHELEHVQDNVDILTTVLTDQRIVAIPQIRRLLVDDGSGRPARVSESELVELFRPGSWGLQTDDMRVIGRFREIDRPLVEIWNSEQTIRARQRDSGAEYSRYSGSISNARQELFHIIEWPQ